MTDVEDLFANLESLLTLGQQFLGALIARTSSNHNFACIGDIVLKFQTVFPLYSRYLRNYDHMLSVLGRLNNNKDFRALTKSLQAASRDPTASLPNYLYRPCQVQFSHLCFFCIPLLHLLFAQQRIPQYMLLLQQLLKYTPGNGLEIRSTFLFD